MPVAVSGPYNCPLCGRKTRDYNVMLAHIHLHNLVAEYGYPALDNLSEEPAEVCICFCGLEILVLLHY